MRFSRRLGLILAVLAADQLSKQLLQQADQPLLPGILSLWGTRNHGAAFGLLAGQGWLLPALGALAAVVLAVCLWREKPRGLYGLGLTLLLAGALGNLIDRLFRGYVIDFLMLDFVSFPVFNIADIAVTLGCVLAAIGLLKNEDRPHG